MPGRLKRSAVVVAAFAGFFYWGFMTAKHDPSLRDIVPFGEDPYDAVGSFAVIVAVLVAVLSLARAFRPYRSSGPSSAEVTYLLRSLATVALAALITVGSNAIAMVRHPSQWLGAGATVDLVVLQGVMLVVAAAILLRLGHGRTRATRQAWTRAGIVGLVAASILVIYPEDWIRRTGTHLLSVVAGALLLFAPMRPLLSALVPLEASAPKGEVDAPSGWRRRGWLRWSAAAVLGLSVGVFAFVGEMSEGGVPSVVKAAVVAAVFGGLGTAGLLIAYALIGKPLGLGER